MSILLGTLCLNEMEWLPYLYEQHKNWPTVVKWVFVEAADAVYYACNPSFVSKDGLSIDGTTEYLEELAAKDDRVIHIKAGIVGNTKSDQNKSACRQLYLNIANKIGPTFVFVLDADEFYTYKAQQNIVDIMEGEKAILSFCFEQINIWRPPNIAHLPLFTYYVKGGYWNIAHIRGWRWQYNIRYNKNHNWPEDPKGRFLINSRHIFNTKWIHLGFASQLSFRAAKHIYYKARGEGEDKQRRMYVACRDYFLKWKLRDSLPHGAKVLPFVGDVPEVFLNADGTCRV